MVTLSSTTSFTRKFLKWMGISIVGILVILIFYRLAVAIKDKITPPAPPTVSFGKLPAVSFPQNQTYKTLSYTIDTVTGALPVFSDRASVYKTIENSPNLLALSDAEKKVRNAGFNDSRTKVSESLYQWTGNNSGSNLERKIIFNIFSGDFNFSSNFLSDPKVLAGNNLPNETAAIDTAQNFLSSVSSLPDDIDNGKTLTTLLSIQNGTLTKTTSLSNTQILQVSFFQKDLNGLPIVYINPNASNINVFVGGGDNGPQVVKTDFFHQNITSENATYPILSTRQAFDKLKNGDGYIASYDGETQKISINKVMLAYFLSDTAQTYAMPVIVFKGNSGFTAYVSAVRDEWIQK